MLDGKENRTMEEFTGELAALEARRKAALETLRTATDPTDVTRLKGELSEIESAIAELGEDEAF